MKIVITGALGHIGSAAIRRLPVLFPNAEFILIDNLSTQRYCSLFNLPVGVQYRFIEDDVLTVDLHSSLKDANAIVHLAAITDAAASFRNRDKVEYNNFSTTARVAEIAAELNCPLIHISSTSVYGTQSELVDENCSANELQPQSPYAETKLKEEMFVRELGESSGLRFATCRFGTICGVSPGMRFHTAVNKFCWQAVHRQPLTVWRTALYQKRPYLVLEDAISAIAFLIRNNLYDRQVYNVLSANMTVNSIITAIKTRVADVRIEFTESEIMNQLSYEVSNLRFVNLGFEFSGSVEDSIDKTIDILSN